MDGLEHVVTVPVEAVGNVAGEVVEPVQEASAAVSESLEAHIRDLAQAVRLSSETQGAQRDALVELRNDVTSILNHITEAGASAALAGVDVANTGVQAVTTVPEAAADTVQAVVESPTAIPVRKPKGMLGAMKKSKRR